MAPVYVDIREQVYVREILVASELATGSVKLDLLAVNTTAQTQSVELQAECGPFVSPYYQPPVPRQRTQAVLGRVRLPPGESRHQFVLKLQDPVRWDVDTPFLYHLKITSGKRLLGQTRFGFREFRVQGTAVSAQWPSPLLGRIEPGRTRCRHLPVQPRELLAARAVPLPRDEHELPPRVQRTGDQDLLRCV